MGEPYESPGGKPLTLALPVEPLYRLEVAAELVPFPTMNSIYLFLFKHPIEFPPRYMRTFGGRQVRVLLASEVRKMREMRLLQNGEDRYHSAAFQARRVQSPIEAIIKRAMSHA